MSYQYLYLLPIPVKPVFLIHLIKVLREAMLVSFYQKRLIFSEKAKRHWYHFNDFKDCVLLWRFWSIKKCIHVFCIEVALSILDAFFLQNVRMPRNVELDLVLTNKISGANLAGMRHLCFCYYYLYGFRLFVIYEWIIFNGRIGKQKSGTNTCQFRKRLSFFL